MLQRKLIWMASVIRASPAQNNDAQSDSNRYKFSLKRCAGKPGAHGLDRTGDLRASDDSSGKQCLASGR
jgi:hypothetical protein